MRVKLIADDFHNCQFVILGRVVPAIVRAAKPNGRPRSDSLNAERKLFPVINAAVQLGFLHPLNPDNCTPLPMDDYGCGILDFAELVEWGHTTKPRLEFEKAVTPSHGTGGQEQVSTLPRRNEWVFSSPTAKLTQGRLTEPRIPHNRALSAAGLPPLTLHGLRRTFASLAEWVEMPRGIVAQIMGHKPSATAEKHYIDRPLELLAVWHGKFEA